MHLTIILIVFVKLNQNDQKYWDGNAIYCLVVVGRVGIIWTGLELFGRVPVIRSNRFVCLVVVGRVGREDNLKFNTFPPRLSRINGISQFL